VIISSFFGECTTFSRSFLFSAMFSVSKLESLKKKVIEKSLKIHPKHVNFNILSLFCRIVYKPVNDATITEGFEK